MLKKLSEFVDREVEIWTQENTEPWEGILREVGPEILVLHIDQLETFIRVDKVVAFRLSEGEQGGRRKEEEEEGEGEEDDER